MKVIYPPNSIEIPENYKSIFLAGSIDMGTAEDWQRRIIQHFNPTDTICFLNPRRKDWDNSWEQSIHNPQFYEQVNWELDGIEKADKVIFYFAPNTKAPITLMELGLNAHKGKSIVYCPEGYWRKGNVDIVCQRFSIQQVINLDELIAQL